jgi:flavin reductase (DIM6/NTAB) family NADH-FMN oxidoreductase RutF
MLHITREAIASAEKQYRTNLINCLSGFRMAMLVGTQNQSGQTNLAIFNSAMHIGAHPPLIGLVFRPDSVDRHTLSNIRATGQYTLNAVPQKLVTAAHQTSARYAADQSEFEACGIAPYFSEKIKAPYVAESPLRYGLELREEIAIQSNGTFLVIGEVQEIWLKAEILEADGSLRPDKAQLLAVAGLDHYYLPSFLAALPYAKP